MLTTWDSMSSFADDADKAVDSHTSARDKSSEWYGGIDFKKSLEYAKHGCDTYAKEAQKYIDKLSCESPSSQGYELVSSPYGYRVSIGDWLTGSPYPMKRRAITFNDVAPIRVIVSTTCSSSVDAETMKQRGAAILALLLKIQESRPVELYLFEEMCGPGSDGWHYGLVKVESKPLNLSQAAFGLVSVAFSRHLAHEYFYQAKFGGYQYGGWPKDHYHKTHDRVKYEKLRAARLGLTNEDIFIGEAYGTDELLVKPVEWINGQLKRLGGYEG